MAIADLSVISHQPPNPNQKTHPINQRLDKRVGEHDERPIRRRQRGDGRQVEVGRDDGLVRFALPSG